MINLGPLRLWPPRCRLRLRLGPVTYKRGLGRVLLPAGWGDVRLSILADGHGLCWSGPWGWLELRLRRRAALRGAEGRGLTELPAELDPEPEEGAP